jgi:hypothetical protein
MLIFSGKQYNHYNSTERLYAWNISSEKIKFIDLNNKCFEITDQCTEIYHIKIPDEAKVRVDTHYNTSDIVIVKRVVQLKNMPEKLLEAHLNENKFFVRFLRNPSIDKVKSYIALKQTNYLNVKLNQELKIFTIEKYPQLFHKLYDGSEEFALTYVKIFPAGIRYINNPSRELCMIAVKSNGLLLESIKNQTEEICIAAVNQNPLAVKFVTIQTKKMQEIAFDKNPMTIIYLKVERDDIRNIEFLKFIKNIRLRGSD